MDCSLGEVQSGKTAKLKSSWSHEKMGIIHLTGIHLSALEEATLKCGSVGHCKDCCDLMHLTSFL